LGHNVDPHIDCTLAEIVGFMAFRGVKSKVFIHLWVLFFIALLIIDGVILFFVLEKAIAGAAGGSEATYTVVYSEYSHIQKVAFVFVVINSFFFALFANNQLARIYYKPLQRLAKRAEAYEDKEQFFFAFRKEDNEFSVLSASLNKMMDRITDDKRILNETIDSLKSANEELKQAQNDVIRAEKLATVGRLTSGIAHEIGNPIGIVLGYLELLKQSDLEMAERNDFIDRSEKEIGRISQIIRQLLDMSRPSDGECQRVSIHQLLNDLICVFKFQPTADEIEFNLDFAACEDVVFGNSGRLRQVFLNILLNAIDAVNLNTIDAKKIDIDTKHINGNRVGAGQDRQNNFIEVSISDSGPGIPPSKIESVFDPFFTTKEPGEGTGLGLSVSIMIVEEFGGQIRVASREDQMGAVFIVVLPLLKGTIDDSTDD
jgi:two-component system NtrC family sensor kinase